MASWSQTFSVNNKYSLTLTVTEQSTDIGANTSTVAYSLVMATAPYSYTGYSDYRTTISCTINGSSVFSYNASRNFNASAAASYSETLCSGTTTVTHNADGTKTCAVAASVSVASGEYSPGSASISQSITLTTIPRASTCSWSGDFTIGSAKTITITRASSSFNHKLKFTVGSASETLPSGGTYASTSYSWTPASGTYSGQFPTQTSRTGTLVLYTYNSGTLIGSNSYTFTLKIPDAWKPSVSVSLSPSTANAFISGTGLYVAGYSAIKATITGTAATGAAISSYTISGAFSKTVNTSSASTVQTSGVIATSGSKSVTVTITDARGRTGSATASCSYTSYAYPAVSALSYARGTYAGGVWTPSDTGEDLKITFTGSCSLSGNGNTMSWSVGAPVTASGSGLTSGSSITQYATGIGTVTAYTVTVTLTDAVGNSTTRSVFVPTIEMPFVIDPALPALGVGAVPQTARTLELASNWMLRAGSIAGSAISGTAPMSPTANIIVPVGRVNGSNIGAASGAINDFLDALLKHICSVYPGFTRCRFIGTGLADVSVYFDLLVYDTSEVNSSGYPLYSFGTAMSWNSAIGTDRWSFGTKNGTRFVTRDSLLSVTKTATISFSAGTIGTRGYQTSWSPSSIGGTPVYAVITHVANSANYLPMAFLEGTTVYFNAYRCTTSAVSNSTVDVTIYYV